MDRAGHVNVDDVSIFTSRGFLQTITPSVQAIRIYEDIFSHFITGTITVVDSHDLFNYIPLVGDESIRLKFSTIGADIQDTYEKQFVIYKIDNKEAIAERQYIYTIYFISQEAIIDVNRKISKGFNGIISDLIIDFCKNETFGLETEKTLNVEETKNKIKYVSNFWTPLQNIQYLCEHAISKTAESPTFIFYETKYGLNFTSLDYIYTSSDIIQAFTVDNYNMEISKSGGSSRDINKDMQRVLEISPQSVFDYFKSLRQGAYGSELISYDLLTKQYSHLAYIPQFGETNHLNEFPLTTNIMYFSPQAVMIQGKSYYNNFDDYADVTNNKIIQKRKSLMAQAESYKITITVHGSTAYSAGQRVLLNMPRKMQYRMTDTDDDIFDKLTSGVYVIASICHAVDRDTHVCTMELIKDSYMVDING